MRKMPNPKTETVHEVWQRMTKDQPNHIAFSQEMRLVPSRGHASYHSIVGKGYERWETSPRQLQEAAEKAASSVKELVQALNKVNQRKTPLTLHELKLEARTRAEDSLARLLTLERQNRKSK